LISGWALWALDEHANNPEAKLSPCTSNHVAVCMTWFFNGPLSTANNTRLGSPPTGAHPGAVDREGDLHDDLSASVAEGTGRARRHRSQQAAPLAVSPLLCARHGRYGRSVPGTGS
jgi:hypothetical protein